MVWPLVWLRRHGDFQQRPPLCPNLKMDQVVVPYSDVHEGFLQKLSSTAKVVQHV
ncbi:hypothetical protein HanIR_Chr13g0659971 [Helianthus annuus]|nr:hypothetical protein HanIR_Chr13g0659971 [Helianthus annuus]